MNKTQQHVLLILIHVLLTHHTPFFQLQDADRFLESFCGRVPASSLLPTLMRAQMALEAGSLDSASQLLSMAGAADLSVSRAGAVVATQVALMEQVTGKHISRTCVSPMQD